MVVLSDHCVARFVREEKDCRNGIIKLRVFTPRATDTNISVFVISGLQENEIWELGRSRVSMFIVGRADMIVSSICEQGLEVVKNDPNDRHAVIIPIPKLPIPDDRDHPRNTSAISKRRDIAIRLRKISTLHIM